MAMRNAPELQGNNDVRIAHRNAYRDLKPNGTKNE